MENAIVNIIAIVALLAVLGVALLYVYKAKKSGQKCVGCPYSKTCGAQEKNACSCHQKQE